MPLADLHICSGDRLSLPGKGRVRVRTIDSCSVSNPSPQSSPLEQGERRHDVLALLILHMRELLLCPPDYYGIEYEINPWMSRARGAEAAIAQKQWEQLHATLSKLDCKVDLIAPQPGLPDMVFTANAGLTISRKFIPSNFRHKERAGEQPFFADWMKQRGYEVQWLPENLYFEGEGDALFSGDVLFCGYDFVPTFNRIAPWQTCLAVSLSPLNWLIRVFTISTPASAHCPMAGRFGFQRPSTSMASEQSASM